MIPGEDDAIDGHHQMNSGSTDVDMVDVEETTGDAEADGPFTF